MAAMFTGCTLLVTESFDPMATPSFLASNDVTVAGSGTPFHLAYLAAQRAAGEESIFPHVRSFPGVAPPSHPNSTTT